MTKLETAVIQIVNNAAAGKIQFLRVLIDLCRVLNVTEETRDQPSSTSRGLASD